MVDNAAEAVRLTSASKVEIVGHADRKGSSSYNLRLARLRALAVKRALVERGVPAEAITARSVGENEPIVPTGDGVEEAQNRYLTIMIW